MKQGDAYFVIVDISGYTDFVQLHRTSMVHAEQIITDLMESVLDQKRSPLILDKLQGDAAIFYAWDDGSPDLAGAIAQQVLDFFRAFQTTEKVLVSCNMCLCEACNRIDSLRLKGILHHGQLLLKEMGGSTELGGADIIVAHRLEKNHIEGNEYIAMSKAFHDRCGNLADLEPHPSTENYGPLGNIEIVTFYPNPSTAPIPKPTLWKKLKSLAKIEWYGIQRMILGKEPPGEFRNLSGGQRDSDEGAVAQKE